MSHDVTAGGIKTVLDGYDAIERRDLEAMLACCTPDVVIETRVETHRGHEGAARMFREAFASEFTNEPQAMLIVGDRIVVLTRLRLVGSMTGIETEQKLLEIWTVPGDLVTRLQVMEREQGLETLGLTERASHVADLYASYEAFNRNDFDQALKLMHSNVEINRGEATLDTDAIHGVDELRTFLEPDVFESQTMEVHTVIATDRRVLVKAILQGRTSGTGIEVSNRSFQVWTMRDWRAERADFFQNQDEALAFLLSD